MIDIVIVEDHELVREGLKKVIRLHADLRVVGEATNVADGLEVVSRYKPHVVIVDLSMEGSTELEGVARLHERFPQTPLLVLSVHPEDRYALRAMKAGASGYVTKLMAVEEVVKAVRKLADGGRYVSTRLAEILAQNVSAPIGKFSHHLLTDRELQVLCLLGSGMQIKQVAAHLTISVSSVNTYRSRLFRKMGLSSNAALVRYAVQHGLVE